MIKMIIRILEQIDSYLLGKFQKISDWFQDWFGVDCFTLARCALILSVFEDSIVVITNMILKKTGPNGYSFVHYSIVIFCFSSLWNFIISAEKIWKNNKNFQNFFGALSVMRNLPILVFVFTGFELISKSTIIFSPAYFLKEKDILGLIITLGTFLLAATFLCVWFWST